MADSLTYLGRIHWRDDKRAFGIHPPDRLAHTYVVGKTGSITTGTRRLDEPQARKCDRLTPPSSPKSPRMSLEIRGRVDMGTWGTLAEQPTTPPCAWQGRFRVSDSLRPRSRRSPLRPITAEPESRQANNSKPRLQWRGREKFDPCHKAVPRHALAKSPQFATIKPTAMCKPGALQPSNRTAIPPVASRPQTPHYRCRTSPRGSQIRRRSTS